MEPFNSGSFVLLIIVSLFEKDIIKWRRFLMTNGKIKLSPEQQSQFEMVIKRGILKEMHRRKMLTDEELSFCLSDIEKSRITTDTKLATE